MEFVVALMLLVMLPAFVFGAWYRSQAAQAKASRLDAVEARLAEVEREREELARHINVLYTLVAAVDHAAYAPFEALFAGHVGSTPLYLSLLHVDAARPALDAIASRCRSPERVRDGVLAMLGQPDWRPHLVAAATLWLLPDPSPYVGPLWERIEAGSWVGPQLVATAARVDEGFEARARSWLDAAASADGWDPKTASALLALLEDDRTAIEAALAVGLASDVDEGGAIARGWGQAMEAALPR